jgi:hypothetical protein
MAACSVGSALLAAPELIRRRHLAAEVQHKQITVR